ncbi:MAG: penicillin-binding protein activator LpoB [Armatimonadetes bacterium]|nr:penicillin-binding protein activator LpoB [Armatimonadota bacterium]
MKTARLVLISIITMTVFFGAASNIQAADKPRIVLAPISDTSVPETGKTKAEGIAEAIRNGLKEALFKSGKFVLVADADIQKDLDAEKFNQYMSGDFNPATAAAIGRKVGAQALVKCSVVTNQLSSKVKDLILFKETEYTMQLAVSVEICDIEQAVICFMHTASTEQKSKSKELDLGTSDKPQPPISLSNPKDVRSMAVNSVVSELAAKIIENAVREKGKGTVTKVSGSGVTGDSIIVNIGSSAGARENVDLTVIGVDEDGFEETIGKATVTAVQEDKSKAVISSTKRPVVVGDRVQIAGGAKPSGSEITTSTGTSPSGTPRQRVMVVVPETHLRMVVPDPAGETEITKRLIEKNYVLVDQNVAKEIANNENLRAKLRGDAEEIIRLLGDRTEAEIIIAGEAFSEGIERISTNAGPAFRCGARIEVRAIQRDNARILYADGAHAIAVDATEALAGKRALQRAAELLCNGRDGVKGFVDAMTERLANPVQIVECVVRGIEDEDALKSVQAGLKSASGGTVHRYSYRDGVAKFSIESGKSAQELTDSISGVDMKGKLKLVGATPNKIELQYVK